jgi:hypothetical protein
MIQTQATSVLDRLLDPVSRSITHDFARELVELWASPEDQARIDELADNARERQSSLMDAATRILVRERVGGRCEYCGFLQAAVPLATFHAPGISGDMPNNQEE